MECPEIDPCTYTQLIIDEGTKAYNEIKVSFSTNGAGTTVYPQIKHIT